jgi:hypothetical protein
MPCESLTGTKGHTKIFFSFDNYNSNADEEARNDFGGLFSFPKPLI